MRSYAFLYGKFVGGFTFFEFKVDDMNAAKELLEKEGCKVTQIYSEKSLMFADPYGMRFHVWQD